MTDTHNHVIRAVAPTEEVTTALGHPEDGRRGDGFAQNDSVGIAQLPR